MAGARTPFAGRFDTNGVVAVVASNAPRRAYNLALQLDLSGLNPLTGSVSNITDGWTASLSAIRAAFGPTMPATNYEGLSAGHQWRDQPRGGPPGYSYATARIALGGGVTLSGTMADGAAFTATGAAISQSGDWPLYGSLFSGKGSVLAWVSSPSTPIRAG